MPLEKDNPSHRNLSDKLDGKYGGGSIYEKVTRPIVHGVYHTARCVSSGNSAELARAKDQFSAVGKGQPRTEYLSSSTKRKQPRMPRENMVEGPAPVYRSIGFQLQTTVR
ncbi:expressed unknown protein [Seminavis robusta]|uniref:Uncharacterized protein n=1 Tax=Seminavis robusta TaxID=568900 RepID=A0A9N8DPD5_9STRA|nr:expressed unknown protein [Seminavis robusta]|eukprot:Sro192_g082451.1  (110) ;mRNA; f:23182-23511